MLLPVSNQRRPSTVQHTYRQIATCIVADYYDHRRLHYISSPRININRFSRLTNPHSLSSLDLHLLPGRQQGLTATMAPPYTRLDTSTPLRISMPRDDVDDSQSSSNTSPTRENYEESDFFEGNNDSQSSIGVPTFQDMAVTEETCLPAINRLPAEVLIAMFSKLSSPADLLSVMLVNKTWASNSVALLWQRPNCADSRKHELICNTISLQHPYFDYSGFVKRLNLQALAKDVNDGTVIPFASCNRIERLTLTHCTRLTDGGLMPLLKNNNNLLALDISNDIDKTRLNSEITHKSIEVLAEHCRKLQGLNVSECRLITNESMVKLAEGCRQIKRVRGYHHCSRITADCVYSLN